jgi:serine/threonine-protein phosphatase 2A regulatory subunit B
MSGGGGTSGVGRASGGGWSFSQVFGDPFGSEDLLDGDIVTAVEFDHSGDMLAVGDKAGRVWLYKRDTDEKIDDANAHEGKLEPKAKRNQYHYYFQFQSHEPEFDYLKSLEIEEKINMVKFCKKKSDSTFLLSTNGEEVAFWFALLTFS